MKKLLCMMLCTIMMCGSVIPVYAQEEETEVKVEVKFPWAPNKDSTDVLKALDRVMHYEPDVSDIPVEEVVEESEVVHDKSDNRSIKELIFNSKYYEMMNYKRLMMLKK
ncbi:hypothetical protein [Frisingicoccus sp.]|uniref:hypothetical protein n=1 Tax=Frisingicoccus sp. TaxID=1918627 RepID=UPI00386FD940